MNDVLYVSILYFKSMKSNQIKTTCMVFLCAMKTNEEGELLVYRIRAIY